MAIIVVITCRLVVHCSLYQRLISTDLVGDDNDDDEVDDDGGPCYDDDDDDVDDDGGPCYDDDDVDDRVIWDAITTLMITTGPLT